LAEEKFGEFGKSTSICQNILAKFYKERVQYDKSIRQNIHQILMSSKTTKIYLAKIQHPYLVYG